MPVPWIMLRIEVALTDCKSLCMYYLSFIGQCRHLTRVKVSLFKGLYSLILDPCFLRCMYAYLTSLLCVKIHSWLKPFLCDQENWFALKNSIEIRRTCSICTKAGSQDVKVFLHVCVLKGAFYKRSMYVQLILSPKYKKRPRALV